LFFQVKEKEMLYKRYREESETAKMVCTLFCLAFSCCKYWICLIDPLIADGGGKGVETAAENDGSPCPASTEF
jgi:hypothetical protein